MQYTGMTLVIMMITFYAVFHLFMMAPLWFKLLILSPLLLPFLRFFWLLWKRFSPALIRRVFH